jgi:type III secretory pathway component EscS
MSPAKSSSTGASSRRAMVDHQTKSGPLAIASQAITRIKDEPFLFVIAVIALLIALTVAAARLGSPDLRFIVAVIAVLAFTVIAGYYLTAVVSSREKSSEVPAPTAPPAAAGGEGAEPTKPDVRPPGSAQSNRYDLWNDELSNGSVEVTFSPGDTDEWNTLARIFGNVLREKKFSETVAGNAGVIFWELLNNVGKHVKNSDAKITLELNTRHLPTVVITVGDEGKGYEWWDKVEQQYLGLKTNGREHGLGRVCRLSDQVLSTAPGDSTSWFGVRCTLYDIPWPGSLCDQYAWCEKVILDYGTPPSVWFGDRRYPLWWQDGNGGWCPLWSVLGALDYSIDNEIPQIMNLYLEHMRVKDTPYLFFEIRGHGFTETGQPRLSSVTISQTVESFFAPHFASKKVVLYRSKGAYHSSLQDLSQRHGLPLYASDSECAAALKKIDDRRSSSRSKTLG